MPEEQPAMPSEMPPEPAVVGGLQFNDPELAAKAQELEAMRAAA